MTSIAEVRFCSSCGSGLESGNRFCTSCGSAIPELEQTEEPQDFLDKPEEESGPSLASEPEPPADPVPVVVDPAQPSAEQVVVSPPTVDDQVGERADIVAASFQFLVVREIDPSLRPEIDGLIYPLPGMTTSSVVSEPGDGLDLKRIVASGFKILDITGGQARRLSAATDLRIDVLITESRIALACSKFKKGGGWTPFGLGAIPVVLVLNGVSKARAASQRRGKMLVGQVRYTWLTAAGGSSKAGFGTHEQLRLCVDTQNRRLLALDLTLPNNVDSNAVAAEILRRAARYRLDHDPRATEHAEELQALTEAASQPGEKGKFGARRMPGPWLVSAEGAYVGLGSI